jgi:Flp pilus assembly pilin Flp
MHLFSTVRRALHKLVSEANGQTMVEYALILFLIALVCIALLTTIGVNVQSVFTTVANGF